MRAAIVLLLAVAVLGATGATMTVSTGGGGGSGFGDADDVGFGSETGDGLFSPPNPLSDPPAIGPGWITDLVGLAILGGMVWAVLVAVLAVYRRDLSALLELLRRTAVILLVTAGIAVGMLAIVALLQMLAEGGGSTGAVGDSESFGADSTENVTGFDLPVTPLLVAVLTGGLLAVLVLWRRGKANDDGDEGASGGAGKERESDGVEPTTASTDEPSTGDPVGAVPADTEVYRSWLALADASGANPRRDSPAEVARSAVDAGVDEGTAREITRLFEEVRYGGASADERRERRAREARSALGGETA